MIMNIFGSLLCDPFRLKGKGIVTDFDNGKRRVHIHRHGVDVNFSYVSFHNVCQT